MTGRLSPILPGSCPRQVSSCERPSGEGAGGDAVVISLFIYWCPICQRQEPFSWHYAWNPRTAHHECVRIEVVAKDEAHLMQEALMSGHADTVREALTMIGHALPETARRVKPEALAALDALVGERAALAPADRKEQQ